MSSSIRKYDSASAASSSSSFQQLVPPPVDTGTPEKFLPRQRRGLSHKALQVFWIVSRDFVSCVLVLQKMPGLDDLFPGFLRERYLLKESVWPENFEARTPVTVLVPAELDLNQPMMLDKNFVHGSLLHISAKYCSLQPRPRSIIAAAFSPDGKTLASTQLLPLSLFFSVRFHPLYPDILASGSLDHEVRLWDAKAANYKLNLIKFLAEILSCRSSDSFNCIPCQRQILAVASGHKLYMWHYAKGRNASSPTVILKTRRTLRAVHFHPHATPFLLTAEVNDLDSSDPSMIPATSRGYLHYPPPTIYLADEHTNNQSSSSTTQDERRNNYSTRETGNSVSEHARDTMDTDMLAESRSNHFFPFGNPANWELLPFLEGWLIGQSQAGQRAMHSQNGDSNEGLPSRSAIGDLSTVGPPVSPSTGRNLRVPRRSGLPNQSPRTRAISTARSGDTAAFNNSQPDQSNAQPFMNQIQSEVATSLAAPAELPCTVKLRIWSYNLKNPSARLDSERCQLIILYVILCSEMGAHFSPCGRFLAVCVACILPTTDVDPGFNSPIHGVIEASTSPTRHPISAQWVMYELRIYSLEKTTFGSVLASRAIRAAHCLKSIQVGQIVHMWLSDLAIILTHLLVLVFSVSYDTVLLSIKLLVYAFSAGDKFSPTSENLLLSYGRRHSSLLKSVVIGGDTTIYRVSDMELVRVLPSAEDEVNVACFHPLVGGGLVYGTKEGKLRILQCDSSHGFSSNKSLIPDDNNMVEVENAHVC
ncbi:hypothetical protein SASPL_147292 [Salvia splendens]|uniref:Activating molecule in BECN1-regulated autophagy protein 1 n=1 Tax=Salvia splendens TaxID=180675 RepID=A0A8X8Z6I0_SALSN|nr:hypothetical protein SASPL_147292 [Salvia splendens]